MEKWNYRLEILVDILRTGVKNEYQSEEPKIFFCKNANKLKKIITSDEL